MLEMPKYKLTTPSPAKSLSRVRVESPLYLANGEEATPLGWNHLEINVQGNIVNLPVVALAPKTLAYDIVLGLDYLFLSTRSM